MRRSIPKVCVLICIKITLLIGFPNISYSQSIPALVKLTSGYIVNEDFENLSLLYLLPSHYPASKKIEERTMINNALQLLSYEFGSISSLIVSQEKKRWINLEIFGGDIDFVKSNPNVIQFVYKSNFSKLGSGFIIIRVYENKGNPKLRSVGYALPDSMQNKEIIKNISRKMLKLMNTKPDSL